MIRYDSKNDLVSIVYNLFLACLSELIELVIQITKGNSNHFTLLALVIKTVFSSVLLVSIALFAVYQNFSSSKYFNDAIFLDTSL